MSKSGELTIEKKWAIISRYNFYVDPTTSKIIRGCCKTVAKECNVSTRTISKIMSQYYELCAKQNTLAPDLSASFKPRTGRPSKLTPELEMKIRQENQATKGRATIRQLAFRCNLDEHTLRRYLIEMESSIVSTWVKPMLSYEQQIKRLQFILNLRSGNQWKFKDQRNVVMVDESWFYLHRTKGYVRLFPGDEMPEPVRVQHKSHIPKIMFLAAVARPDFERGFDGKISLIRVCEERIAERTTRNRERGDVYFHDCTMNAELYRDFMMQIISEIKVKMPWLKGKPVVIQQDGASPHVGKGNLDYFYYEGKKDGWDINVVTQPPQSPDLNINDLGFFRSLKCRTEQFKNGANTVEEMFDAIGQAWTEYDGLTLERIWAHQYHCYREIMSSMGTNNYISPHLGVRNEVNPIKLHIDKEIYIEARNLINDYYGN